MTHRPNQAGHFACHSNKIFHSFILQRGSIYSEVNYPGGPPTSGAQLLRDSPKLITDQIKKAYSYSPWAVITLSHIRDANLAFRDLCAYDANWRIIG